MSAKTATKVDEKQKNDKSKKTVKVSQQKDESDDEQETKNKKIKGSKSETKTELESKTDEKTKGEKTKGEKTTRSDKTDDKTDKTDKTDKSAKSTKSDKQDSTDVKKTKMYPNDETMKAGTHFNVKATKQWLQDYYSEYTVQVVTKDKDSGDKIVRQGKVKFTFGAHWCLTATDQVICSVLLHAASKRAQKGVDGLYTITELNVRDCVENDPELRFAFARFLPFYQSKNKYIQFMKLSSADLKTFVDKYCVNSNSSICVESSALNLVVCIMHESRKMLAESAYQMCQYANKSSVNDKAFLCSIKTIYADGSLQGALTAKAYDTANRARGVELDAKAMSDKSSSTEDKSGKNSKKSKEQKNSKSGNKKNLKEENSDDDDDDDDDDDASDAESNVSGDDSDVESDDAGSNNGSDNDSDDGSDDEPVPEKNSKKKR